MTTAGGRSLLKVGEPWVIWVLGAFALSAYPVLRGESGLIWDALNHHIYLGWTAAAPRFDRDFLAAGWQSYQYPYLYWPAYKLASMGASGVTAGVVFALLQSLAIPPLWLITRSLCPGEQTADVALRCLGVGFAFTGGVTLSLADTTSNDLLTGVPLLWAIALGLRVHESEPQRHAGRLVLLSGLCAGASVAFKLSNGPLALVLPLLWAGIPTHLLPATKRIALGGAATILGFAVVYAPWGLTMWEQFGNPIYPFRDAAFNPLREMLGWRRP